MLLDRTPVDQLDFASPLPGLGGKVGFDATRPFPHTPNFTRARVKPASLDGLDIDVPEIKVPEIR